MTILKVLPIIAVANTAIAIGFGVFMVDTNAFHRAFRAWTGQTPAQVRAASD